MDEKEIYINCATCQLLSKFPIFGNKYLCCIQGEVLDREELEETCCMLHQPDLKNSSKE